MLKARPFYKKIDFSKIIVEHDDNYPSSEIFYNNKGNKLVFVLFNCLCSRNSTTGIQIVFEKKGYSNVNLRKLFKLYDYFKLHMIRHHTEPKENGDFNNIVDLITDLNIKYLKDGVWDKNYRCFNEHRYEYVNLKLEINGIFHGKLDMRVIECEYLKEANPQSIDVERWEQTRFPYESMTEGGGIEEDQSEGDYSSDEN